MRNSSHTVLNQHDYLYNVANQRTNEVRTDGSYVNCTYDPIGQLQSALGYTSGGTPISTETKGYKYDAGQNLNIRTNNGSTTTFSVNVKNELTGQTYDANGNATLFNFNTLAYDAENRLVQISGYNNAFRYEFTYDGFGRLRVRNIYAWNGAAWALQSGIKYIYDGWTVIQERDYPGVPTVSYTRGPDVSGTLQGAGGIGGMLARSSGYSSGSWSTHHAYHADGGGNITAMVNTSQTLSANYRYDAFGNLLSSSGSMASANTYRFSSKEWIPNADLYYYGYRFYSPNYQRWINQDPIGEKGGINLFRYSEGNPVNTIDPFGLDGVPAANSVSANPRLAAELALEEQGLPNACNLASKLARNLARAGRPVAKDDKAHHIVAENAKAAQEARDVLNKFKIGVDDAANGVGLPQKIHGPLHTKGYYDEVNAVARAWKSREDALKGLKKIADDLAKIAEGCK